LDAGGLGDENRASAFGIWVWRVRVAAHDGSSLTRRRVLGKTLHRSAIELKLLV
jgi:uncharacterized RDD family membrane protein YckC